MRVGGRLNGLATLGSKPAATGTLLAGFGLCIWIALSVLGGASDEGREKRHHVVSLEGVVQAGVTAVDEGEQAEIAGNSETSCHVGHRASLGEIHVGAAPAVVRGKIDRERRERLDLDPHLVRGRPSRCAT